MLPTNLVLGAAIGYTWAQVAPFVLSVRRACPAARVILLTGDIDATIASKLAEQRIETVRVRPPLAWLPERIRRQRYNRRRFSWAHRAITHSIGRAPAPQQLKTALLARVAPLFHHPACSRYFYYFRALQNTRGPIGQVLLSDVRDVVFQADPFLGAPEHGQVFIEATARHGHDWGNDRWVDLGFGAAGRQALDGKPVTCSGVTLAPRDTMVDYLAKMTCELALRTHRLSGLDGVDQGVHNWLFWTGQLPHFVATTNYAGPVLTMHGMPENEFTVDGLDRVIDRHGSPVPVLHQYDRHPRIAAHVLRALPEDGPTPARW